MSINVIYSNIVNEIKSIVNARAISLEVINEKIGQIIKKQDLPFEALETLCLSSHYLSEVVPFGRLRKQRDFDEEDLHFLIAGYARLAITEKYNAEKDPKWISPCVGGRRLSVAKLSTLTGVEKIHCLTMTSIGYGINQTLFGMFRNFRDPGAEQAVVIDHLRQDTLHAAIDEQFNVIRSFISEAMFFDHEDRDLQARGNYALGLLRMFRGELKTFAGPVYRRKFLDANEYDAVRVIGGLYRLVRRNTRELRCELSFLAIKAAELDSPTIRAIANHAMHNAIELAKFKNTRKSGEAVPS